MTSHFSIRSTLRILVTIFLGLLLAACGGGGGGSNLAASAPPVFARYAFAANESDNSVSSYVVDADTGRLRYIGKAATGDGDGVKHNPGIISG